MQTHLLSELNALILNMFSEINVLTMSASMENQPEPWSVVVCVWLVHIPMSVPGVNNC